MSKVEESAAAQDPNSIDNMPISKVSINKYDPFQLKCSIDEEIVCVSTVNYQVILYYQFFLNNGNTCLTNNL